MGKVDRWESNGPSYWDVAEHLAWLRDKYGVGTRFLVVPPIARRGTDQRGSWCVSLQTWPLGGKEGAETCAQATFGYGGAWKTLPSAMLQAAIDVTDKLEARERDAAKQAAF